VDGDLVDFFGKPANIPIRPIAIALKYEAVVPLAIHRNSHHTYTIIMEKSHELIKTGDKKVFVSILRE